MREGGTLFGQFQKPFSAICDNDTAQSRKETVEGRSEEMGTDTTHTDDVVSWTNWVGNQTCNPAQILTPRSEAEVQEAVRAARRVRCAATGHSFTPIHVTDGTLLTMDGLQGEIRVDAASGRASALSGTTV